MCISLIICFCFCRFVVSGLTKGETYVFRVQAINELGLSEESQESAPLTVKAALSQLYLFFWSFKLMIKIIFKRLFNYYWILC